MRARLSDRRSARARPLGRAPPPSGPTMGTAPCGLQRGFGSAAGEKRPPFLATMTSGCRHGPPGREGLTHCRPPNSAESSNPRHPCIWQQMGGLGAGERGCFLRHMWVRVGHGWGRANSPSTPCPARVHEQDKPTPPPQEASLVPSCSFLRRHSTAATWEAFLPPALNQGEGAARLRAAPARARRGRLSILD